MEKRERFASRLGFLLISAGCAIGLGNVWRFPYITGRYGGAAFVVLYLIFLVILGMPVMVMEFAVGRASQKSCARSFERLEPKGSKWHWYKWMGFGGCYLLMMFYTSVSGWMLSYIVKNAAGTFEGLDSAAVSDVFSTMLANPAEQVGWMLVSVAIGFAICSLGLQNGVERITKWMMACLFLIMIVLCVRSVTLEGAGEGLKFYLVPDFGKMFEGATLGEKLTNFGEAVYAAMGQSFFTLSLGISAMAIFGSYIGKERRLTGEALSIGVLDTTVALMAGLIIFPACSAFGVDPGEGPSLVFITLPSVFNQMWGGRLWGALFFLFMSCAALSTVIAVFENLISFSMDQWNWSRKKAVAVNGVAVTLLSLPCALGPSLLSFVSLPAIGDIQSIEDFLVSNNILPLGSLVYLVFCVSKRGWGWDNFIAEADEGSGVRFPRWARGYLTWGLPVLILVILVMGYVPKVQAWLGLA
ncbi:MAG TPA: sodium-dependent transporter [Candidatus Ruthenibacterium merdigallinarum]|nr:sodium-dependent transporter [Candidatus Ruthenibacterium merdigallinarum]